MTVAQITVNDDESPLRNQGPPSVSIEEPNSRDERDKTGLASFRGYRFGTDCREIDGPFLRDVQQETNRTSTQKRFESLFGEDVETLYWCDSKFGLFAGTYIFANYQQELISIVRESLTSKYGSGSGGKISVKQANELGCNRIVSGAEAPSRISWNLNERQKIHLIDCMSAWKEKQIENRNYERTGHRLNTGINKLELLWYIDPILFAAAAEAQTKESLDNL